MQNLPLSAVDDLGRLAGGEEEESAPFSSLVECLQ